jgi:cytochrome c5
MRVKGLRRAEVQHRCAGGTAKLERTMYRHRVLSISMLDSAQRWVWLATLTVAVAAALTSAPASAQRRERTGKEVVDATCAACHASGANGAPKIGDATAWKARASQGLAALTEHALKGIRNMPAHGGNPGISDIEIERAITYMVNASGGHWVEPLGGATPTVVRTGEQIVKMQCSKCHQDGLNGAPKIGDRAAWTPRLRNGLDALVKSAVHGHGGMPARGGIADLTDVEIQGAVVYMFNYGIPEPTPAKATPPADPYHKVIAGTEVYLGIVRAEAAPAGQAGAPSGKDYYYLNVSLFDAKNKAVIGNATVKLTVADPFSTESKTLDVIAANNAISYGGYFRMVGPDPYTITAQIRRPGVAGVTEAKFAYKVW